ncbi:hypothetical protein PR003_g22947 [Phytophthora rubi]|uniref:Uncharacterized protein n=1 Tax=Phytophthora rubi TaxID=129364 RepID=A0A6A3J2Z5_9STRA|nr:hypothetical protein PR002_g22235 [Phytophthora rubi]KAE8989730.1 hypothetical protein PR001_g21694 [Phytophthora rubi]KAE9299625.1 hypothetical protein PR003_g22947 [Phytophthora rubi]
MGKNKLKQQLKRQQRDVLTAASTGASNAAVENSRSKKKQKTEKSTGETEVEIDTLSFDDAFSAGLAFEQLESYDGALAAFQQAVKCEPSHLGALTRLADVYSAAGQPDDALKCYVQASELQDGEKDASVWFRLGLAHAAVEQHREATKAYKKSMKINAEALEAGNVKEVDDEDVVELRKAYGVTLAALAEAFGEMGDLDAAVKVFEDAAVKFPENANLHYNLANMRMARSGNAGDDAFDADVVKSLETAIELSPDTRDFVEDLAAYLEQHDQQTDRVIELKAKAEELKSAETTEEKEGGIEEEKEGESEDEEEEEEEDDEDEDEEEGN